MQFNRKSNEKARERLMNKLSDDKLPIALTHYAFRNGPVEDMHADGKLSESDMKTLNKYMVNKIATILFLISEERWAELEVLLSVYSIYGAGWDEPEIDLNEIRDIIAILSEDKR